MPAVESYTQKFKHAGHISWRKVKDEAVLLDLETSAYFSLNEVGVLIWEQLGLGRTPAQAADAVGREYDVPPDAARRDVIELVQDLVKRKLILSMDHDR